MSRLVIALAAASSVLLAGCGSDKKDSGAGGCDVSVSGDQGKKPDVSVPTKCAAPTALQTKDLIPGTGDPVKAGDTVTVNYTLYGWDDGKLVESSYDSNQPFPVQNVGSAAVIDGWNQGLIGIKQGGRRLLLVPPSLGYGAQGNGPIKPNEALVFVVDAVTVAPAGK